MACRGRHLAGKTGDGSELQVSIDTMVDPFRQPTNKSPAMQIDEKTVRHIARLARLKITDAEATSLEGELTSLLKWVEQLNEVDTEGVEPMSRVVAMKMKRREDKVTDGEIAADVVANAPMVEDNYFVVPKVVE